MGLCPLVLVARRRPHAARSLSHTWQAAVQRMAACGSSSSPPIGGGGRSVFVQDHHTRLGVSGERGGSGGVRSRMRGALACVERTLLCAEVCGFTRCGSGVQVCVHARLFDVSM